MQLVNCRAIMIAWVAVVAAGSNAALAYPSHRYHRAVHRSAHSHFHHGHHYALRQTGQNFEQTDNLNSDYSGSGAQHYAIADQQSKAYAPRRAHYRHLRRLREVAAPVASFGGLGGGSLVADARRYLGTNPTGRRSLWCGAFMDKVLRDSGYRGGGNLARGYLHYGTRVSGPQVGAIAVMGRRRGGHVGVVSGVDANGNPIVISGNHNHTVAESVYPRGRIIAYVMPNS